MPRKNHGDPNTRAARGRAARRLGHDFERATAADMRTAGFPDAGRHLEYQSRHANGVDLENTGKFRVQCKRSAKVFASPLVMDEIQPEAGTVPIVVTKIDRRPPIAYIYWSDLLRLIREIQTGSPEHFIPKAESNEEGTESDS